MKDLFEDDATDLVYVSKTKTKDMKKTLGDLKQKGMDAVIVDEEDMEEKPKFKKKVKNLKEDGGCGCGGTKKSLTENKISREDIIDVAMSIGKGVPRDEVIDEILADYPAEQREDPEANWSWVVEDMLYDKLNENLKRGKSLREVDTMGGDFLPKSKGSTPGMTAASNYTRESGKVNKASYDNSIAKVAAYNKIKLKPQIVDNGGTPKTAVGDNYTQKFGVANEEEYVEELAKSGMNNLDLDYDREPSEKFKKRVQDDLDGDRSIAMKIAKKRAELQGNQSVYSTMYKDPKPMKDLVNLKKAFGKNRNVENESIVNKIDKIIAENKKGKEQLKAKDLKLKKDDKKKFQLNKEGWTTIVDNEMLKDIQSNPQPRFTTPANEMKIVGGIQGINLGSLRVENANDLSKVILPESYKSNGCTFDITDGNRTAKVRYENDDLIVLNDKNVKMISEETDKIFKLMKYNFNDKKSSSVINQDVNARVKSMLKEVKGIAKGE